LDYVSVVLSIDTTETNIENNAMFTKTSLKHTTFQKRIKRALWLAKLQSMKTGKRCTEYIKNRKGNACIRIDVYSDGNMSAYASGMGSKDISKMILKALDN
jgi:hypothetical protein